MDIDIWIFEFFEFFDFFEFRRGGDIVFINGNGSGLEDDTRGETIGKRRYSQIVEMDS